MSCGRIALDRLGIPVDKYYASEIDKYAIQVSEANYPDIIRLGDVCDVKAEDLPKIDLLIAGSPCQGFSFAGKQLAFDDPRSALFFEFVRLLKECKPKYFLLENVRMKKEFLDIISEQVGCEPIFINSALVSAQNRQRFYWTNIPGIEQPEQKGIVLRDILETTPADPTLMSDSFVARQKKNINGKCLVDQNKEKAASLSAMEYVKNGRQGDYLACDNLGHPKVITGGAMRGRAYDIEGKRMDKDGISVANKTTQMLELRKDAKSNAITTVGKDSLVVKSHARAYNRNDGLGEKLEKSFALNASDWRGLNRNQNQNAVVAENKNEVYWRKLTPVECERLQTVPDNYTDCVSNTQRYKMLGNGWTIETICHIFKNMQLIEDGKDIPRATGQQTLDF